MNSLKCNLTLLAFFLLFIVDVKCCEKGQPQQAEGLGCRCLDHWMKSTI